MNETQFKSKFLRKLKPFGGWWYKTNDKFTAGIPDIIGCYKGMFVGFELKVGTNTPSKIQKYMVEEINGNAGRVYVTYPKHMPYLKNVFVEIDMFLGCQAGTIRSLAFSEWPI